MNVIADIVVYTVASVVAPQTYRCIDVCDNWPVKWQKCWNVCFHNHAADTLWIHRDLACWRLTRYHWFFFCPGLTPPSAVKDSMLLDVAPGVGLGPVLWLNLSKREMYGNCTEVDKIGLSARPVNMVMNLRVPWRRLFSWLTERLGFSGRALRHAVSLVSQFFSHCVECRFPRCLKCSD